MKRIKITGISPSIDPQGMEIHFSDGLTKIIPYQELRNHCPCAPCKASKETISESGYQIKGVNWVGNYALGILWADGHSTGIYPFENLHRLGIEKKAIIH